MSKQRQERGRVKQGVKSNRPGHRRRIRIPDLMPLLAIAAASLLLVVTCGETQPTDAPTGVAVAATPTPEMPTAARPTDTVTPVPTDTVAPVPTNTVAATQTEAATNTPSPLAPTATPVTPTATATPVPTDTPLPTSTPAQPTRTPVPPTATAPPPPQFPWRGQVVGTFSNCALTRVMGLSLDRNGGIAGDIWVHFWADGWDGAWARSTWGVNEGYPGLDDSSNWDGILATYAKAGTWLVCVVPAEGSWDCISTLSTPTSPPSLSIMRLTMERPRPWPSSPAA
jgi:hypothetical protein